MFGYRDHLFGYQGTKMFGCRGIRMFNYRGIRMFGYQISLDNPRSVIEVLVHDMLLLMYPVTRPTLKR